MRRQSSKFLIDQRQQFLGGFGIALLGALEDLGDIAHATQSSAVVGGDNFKRLWQLPAEIVLAQPSALWLILTSCN